jgi:hypothetical protein
MPADSELSSLVSLPSARLPRLVKSVQLPRPVRWLGVHHHPVGGAPSVRDYRLCVQESEAGRDRSGEMSQRRILARPAEPRQGRMRVHRGEAQRTLRRRRRRRRRRRKQCGREWSIRDDVKRLSLSSVVVIVSGSVDQSVRVCGDLDLMTRCRDSLTAPHPHTHPHHHRIARMLRVFFIISSRARLPLLISRKQLGSRAQVVHRGWGVSLYVHRRPAYNAQVQIIQHTRTSLRIQQFSVEYICMHACTRNLETISIAMCGQAPVGLVECEQTVFT